MTILPLPLPLPADVARCRGYRQRTEFDEPEPCPLRQECLRFLSPVRPGFEGRQVWLVPNPPAGPAGGELSRCELLMHVTASPPGQGGGNGGLLLARERNQQLLMAAIGMRPFDHSPAGPIHNTHEQKHNPT